MTELVSMHDYAVKHNVPYSTVSSCFKRARKHNIPTPTIMGTRKSASFNLINLFDYDQLHEFFIANTPRLDYQRRNKTDDDYYTFIHACQFIGINYFEAKAKLIKYGISPANTKQGDGVTAHVRTTLYTIQSLRDALALADEREKTPQQIKPQMNHSPLIIDYDYDGLMSRLFGKSYQDNQADNMVDFLGCYK